MKKKRKIKRRKAIYVVGPSIAYIPLTRGQFSVVDREKAWILEKYSWRVIDNSTGGFYATTALSSRDGSTRSMRMHNFLFKPMEDEVYLDHKDPARSLDNRRANVRECTRSQNAHNKRRTSANTSGYKGVSWASTKSKWRATIRVKGVSTHLGYFTDPVTAHAAYCEAASRMVGEFARYE